MSSRGHWQRSKAQQRVQGGQRVQVERLFEPRSAQPGRYLASDGVGGRLRRPLRPADNRAAARGPGGQGDAWDGAGARAPADLTERQRGLKERKNTREDGLLSLRWEVLD